MDHGQCRAGECHCRDEAGKAAVLRVLSEPGEGDNVVSDYTYSAAFIVDDEPRTVDFSLFDNARRIWFDGKLFYSECLHDWLNDDRSLPVVIAADKTANRCADAL